MLAAFATTILFSLSAICGQRTSKLLGGTEANFWRLIFATLLLGVYAHGFGLGVKGAAFPVLLLSGGIGFGIGDVALFQALPRLGSRLSMIFVACLSAPVAALIEWLWLGNTLRPAEVAAAVLVLIGVAVALAPGSKPLQADRSLPVQNSTAALDEVSPELPSVPVRPSIIPGIIFGSIAAVCQALGAVLSRKAFDLARLAGENIDGITAAYQRILGGVGITAICLLVVKRRAVCAALGIGDGPERPQLGVSRGAAWRRAWPLVLLNGLAGPVLGVSCYQYALKTARTGIVMPIVAITPLVIIPFSVYLEGERPTVRSLVGGGIAVAGAVLLTIIASA